MRFVEEKADGRLSLGVGTLYGALNTLEEKGWGRKNGWTNGQNERSGGNESEVE